MQPTVPWDTLSAHAQKTSTLCVCEGGGGVGGGCGLNSFSINFQHLFMTIIALWGLATPSWISINLICIRIVESKGRTKFLWAINIGC